MINTRCLESTPAHAASEVDCTSIDLRNYRAYGLLDGIGTEHGRDYLYSDTDVLGHIAPLVFVAPCGLGLKRAHELIFAPAWFMDSWAVPGFAV